MKKKTAKKSTTRWIVMCLGDGRLPKQKPRWSSDVPDVYKTKRGALAAANRASKNGLLYKVVPKK